MKKLAVRVVILLMILGLTACKSDLKEKPETVETTSTTESTSVPGIYSPYDSAEYTGKDVYQIEQDLKKAGFQNIEMTAVEDITSSDPIADGAIESVVIDNKEEFDKTLIFSEDAVVKVIYHSVPKLKAPLSPEEALAFSYMEVGEKYFNVGFTNIHTEEVYDLEPGTKSRTEVKLGEKSVNETMDLPFDGEINITGHYPRSQYTVKVNVDFIGNWIFSKYDVDVRLGDQPLGVLAHGVDEKFELDLEEGIYKLIFYKAEDAEVQGETTLDIHSDAELNYIISTSSDEVSVQLDSQTSKLKSDQIKLPFSNEHYLRMDIEQAVLELKDLGFTKINTSESHDNVWAYSPANSVTSIAIDGRTQFEHDEIVPQTAEVKLFYHVSDFSFEENEITVTEKDSFEIPYTLTSGDPLDSISFVIDDEKVVRQNQEGGFDALLPGKTVITAVSGGRVCSKCDISVEEIVVPIEELTLSAAEMNVAVGSYFDLSYSYKPENSNYTDVVVTTSNNLIEDCKNGKYYAAEPGDCEITYTQDERVLAVCKVHSETVDITALNLDEDPLEIAMGEKTNVSFDLEPENATNKGIKVTSSDSKVAEVSFDERGESQIAVQGGNAGKADIIITVPDGTEHKKSVEVREILPTELQIAFKDPETVLQVGTPIDLEVKWVPEETSIKEISWQSSNPGVLKINPDGTMEAVKVGQATLTARHKSGVTGTMQIEVQPTPVKRIEISTDYDGEDFVKGNQMTLIAKVYPENATDKTLQWSSSDTTVLTVNNQGVVTAVGEGGAVITAESKNGVKGEYPMGANPAPQKFAITWSLTMVSNDHVGSNWTRGCELNGASCNSGSTMTFAPGEEISVNLWAQENDSRPDEDAYFTKIKLTEEIRKNGFAEEGELYVTENGGRYSGNQAVWKFKFSMKPVNW